MMALSRMRAALHLQGLLVLRVHPKILILRALIPSLVRIPVPVRFLRSLHCLFTLV